MKNTSFKFIAIAVLCAVTLFCQAQRPPLNPPTCSNPNGGQRAYNRVMFFLTLSDREDKRIETGALNEAVEQIRPVADETICASLNQLVQANSKYKSVDDNLDTKSTKYYYRTDNLYYIFWDRKPQYDDTPYMGPKTLFIVVSLDYQNILEYYF